MGIDGHSCCGCGCSMPEKNLVNGKPTWFGSFKMAELIEFVCSTCYEKGVRTKGQKRAKEKV
jgi:hypothetical protein